MNTSYLWENGWLQKVKDIYVLKMFMPFPLKENNCFLAESDTGWVVIDTGVNLEANRTIFMDALDAIDISGQQIAAIYLTHYHHDHIGLAGWLQDKFHAPVYLPPADIATWQKFINTDSYLDQALDRCLLAGWPVNLAEELADDIKRIKPLLQPLPVMNPLYPDHPLNWAGQTYTLIPVPGHSDGHCVFFGPESGILFSGDNIVAHTILHLTDWPHNRISSPYDEHLAALNHLGQLPIDMVLPGHGQVFSNLKERLDLIVNHHKKRKALIYHALQHPVTAWELAEAVFKPNHYIHIKRLVLAETLAYLQSLLNEGLVESELVNGSFIYQRTIH